MRGRYLLRAVLGCATAAAVACPTALGALPPQDTVTGQVVVPQFSFPSAFYTNIRIDARSGPSGQTPTGTVGIYECERGICGLIPSERGGDVTCLRVEGNRAIIGYYGPIYQDPVSLDRIRFRGLVEVVDNGPPSERADELTVVARPVFIGFPDPDVPITTCPATLPPGAEYHPFPPPPNPDDPEAGHLSNSPQDFTVTDAQSIPTSKDQCKNNGWRNFPGFKNQGDCVSFVATGGKRQPAS